MVKQGQRVEELTKKVGQVPRTGTVKEVKGGMVIVKWDDGHESTVFGEQGLTTSQR
ncbi:MAG: hypothetical protein M3N51_11835 [Actinomycetota bacterium]|nr:hypothetical protein [Actinomycetota bacterium]